MKASPSSKDDEQDQEIIDLLKDLASFKSEYPPELLTARRAAFLAHVDQLTTVDVDEELSAEDQEIVKLLRQLKSVPLEYPPELLASRRSALLRQMKRVEAKSVWNELHASIQRIFRLPALMRLSLVIGSLVAAVLLGSLFLRSTDQAFQPSFLQAAATPTHLLPITGEVGITICKPEERTTSCPSAELDPGQDFANLENGMAQPAVSKDARSSQEGVHKAAYVNDGHGGASWVSDSADSWIKIDLGQIRTINTVSLQKGNSGSSYDNDPGQFVIAVAVSDTYADGDSNHDYAEYAQVFHSEQTGFSGSLSQAETIQTWFSPVQARFIKITFEKAGAAIEQVGVFMAPPPERAGQPTRTPGVNASEITPTPVPTGTPLAIATQTATSAPSGTQLPTNTTIPSLTSTSQSTNTSTPRPTNTLRPTYTSTPVPTEPSPSDTPVPSPTLIPPTAIPATVQATAASTDTIVVTGHDQTLTFICNGNAAEIRGHANTVTLLGSCSSITVTGNRNRVFWESGAPVITNRGKDNIIQQLQ